MSFQDFLQSAFIIQFLGLAGHTQAAVIFVCALTLFFHVRMDERTFAYAPTILTTTGIFFTFLGIAVGLADFKTDNVQASVPALLGGLKTAFWASVAGVGGALTIKIRHYLAGPKESPLEKPEDEISAYDLAVLLSNIQRALVGQEEGTLISQLKLSRQDTNDRLDALKLAQVEALQHLSQLSSKTLVEALRDVISDFNNKITEQFGDNFKQLNEAVGKLLAWQDRYRTFVDEITLRLVQVINTMTAASASYSELVEKSQTFTTVSSDLSRLLSGLEVQKQQLEASLQALASLLLAASGSLPQIETKVLEITDQLASAVTQNQQSVGLSVAENSQLLRSSTQEASNQIRTALAEHQRELTKGLSDNIALIKGSVESANRELSSANQEFGRQMVDLAGKTREQVSALDAALTEELQKSLQSLGRQLAALSEKFVSDYGPLTEKLALVVKLART